MTQAADGPTISCEVCDLLHKASAERCDRCNHALGTTPDWNALRAEVPKLRWWIVLGAVVFVVMVALNFMVFGGAGMVILTAPIGWIMYSSYRLWVLRRFLGYARGRAGAV